MSTCDHDLGIFINRLWPFKLSVQCKHCYTSFVWRSIDSDHSSYLFSTDTVIHRLYDIQSTTQRTTCIAYNHLSLPWYSFYIILSTYAYFHYVCVVNNSPCSMWMTTTSLPATQPHEPPSSDRRYITTHTHTVPIYCINFFNILYFRQFLTIMNILF